MKKNNKKNDMLEFIKRAETLKKNNPIEFYKIFGKIEGLNQNQKSTNKYKK